MKKHNPKKLTPQEQRIKDSLKPHEAQHGYPQSKVKWDSSYRQVRLDLKNYRWTIMDTHPYRNYKVIPNRYVDDIDPILDEVALGEAFERRLRMIAKRNKILIPKDVRESMLKFRRSIK